MHARINITLPAETVRLIDRAAPPRERSRLIDVAVRYYLHAMRRANLRKRLHHGAVARAARDLELADDWLRLDEEAWRKSAK